MPTSAGFAVTGRSGKMRIQSLPVFAVARVRTLRADSIWLLVMRAGVSAFKPNDPNFTLMPRVSGRFKRFSLKRCVCHLRCFTFLGNNICQILAARWRCISHADCCLLVLIDIAAEDPYLDTDDAVGEVSLLVSKIDISAEGLKWNATLLELFLAAHLCPAETAGDGDTHTLDLACGDNF